ncbi:hypothetical protein F5148DRAFT_1213759 [Russula earlei]|uniref:Uncharacterized protein n=1 Tax=Russula earlei TaxID=71964 RepID=A0ACC0U505_9AGAM|nr:hypothetical protein F5148DRAFT_1213759 [Russula earlei]
MRIALFTFYLAVCLPPLFAAPGCMDDIRDTIEFGRSLILPPKGYSHQPKFPNDSDTDEQIHRKAQYYFTWVHDLHKPPIPTFPKYVKDFRTKKWILEANATPQQVHVWQKWLEWREAERKKYAPVKKKSLLDHLQEWRGKVKLGR